MASSDDHNNVTLDDDSCCTSDGDQDNEDEWITYLMKNDESPEIIYQPKIKHAKLIGNRYLKGGVLGEGAYGKVKEVLDTYTLKRLAVKILKNAKLKRIPNGEQNVLREIRLLKGLSHKNIVTLCEVVTCDEKQKRYMIMEYCFTVMQSLLEKTPSGKFPLWQAHLYFAQLVNGLDYLHSRRIIHKDVKPGNLLITHDQILKITDFGVAEELDLFALDDKISTSQGSPAFQPPEVANGHDTFSGFKLDTWAVGITLFKMTSGVYPFEGRTVFTLFENIGKGQYTIPDVLKHESELKDLINGILMLDENERMDIWAIKVHSWTRRKFIKTAEFIKPNDNDDMSVLPYLEALHPESVVPDNEEDDNVLNQSGTSDHFRNHASVSNSSANQSSGIAPQEKKSRKISGCKSQ